MSLGANENVEFYVGASEDRRRVSTTTLDLALRALMACPVDAPASDVQGMPHPDFADIAERVEACFRVLGHRESCNPEVDIRVEVADIFEVP